MTRSYQLEAVSFAVGNLDRMYFTVLAEIGNVFASPKPPPQRVDAAIGQATTYCTDGRLALRLDDWRGAIEGAAFNGALKHRRYRTLASALRSINDPLRRYIQRLYQLQYGSSHGAHDLLRTVPADGTPDSVPPDRQWDLRTVLELVKSFAFKALQEEEFQGSTEDVEDACEQAIRNYDRALSLALVHLIGHARQDLAMERL